jgi:TonB family protein
MIATWMLYASLVGLFVSLAAHALDRAARANGLPSRFIWLAAMIATLLAPVVGYAVRRASLNAAATAGVTAGRATSLGPVNGVSRPATLNAFSTAVAKLRVAAVKGDSEVAVIWAAFTLLLLGRLAFATGMLWRDRRNWTAHEICGVSLFVTPDLGPAVVALPRSEILFPEWLLSLDEAHIAMVLRHEREHRTAGDPRVLIAATVLTALIPWNPALWWQMRRLRLAVEMDCDARVLRADPRIDRYGSLLLAIAQHPRTALYAAATLTESTSNLERRIDAMTRTPSSAPRITAAALGALAVAAVFAACMTPSPDLIVAPTDKSAATAAASPMFEFQVEKPATPVPGNTSPKYPDQLRTAGIGGVVVAKFVVDTTGRADMGTFQAIKSDHDLFAHSVRQSLPDMRFVPAEVAGHRVKQLMQMPFIFALSSEELAFRKSIAGTMIPDSGSQKMIPGGMTAASGSRKTSPSATIPLSAIPGSHPGSEAVMSSEVPGNPHFATIRAAGDTILPVLKPYNTPPMYPNQLRAANIEGQVFAQFLVRSDGSVDARTLEIVKSDHELFTNSVRNAVKAFRFSPAMVRGKPVDWLLAMPFVFSLSK